MRVVTLIALACIVGTGCDDYPRDPHQTYQRVHHGTLRVGLIENPPWAEHTTSGPAGVDADLVLGLGKSLSADVEIHWGTEAEHFEALKNYRLDLVAGGLPESSPWKKHAAFTEPYYRPEHGISCLGHFEEPPVKPRVMVVAQGENRWLITVEKYLTAHRESAFENACREREGRP